jgi:peptidoglycan/LPS O-acetylase OafA/YrhL
MATHAPAAVAEGEKNYFVSLEMGRFLAAFLVAGFHASSSAAKVFGYFPLDDVFHGGHSGVEYFFLLSGFLIYWIHRHDFGKPRALQTFVLKRAIRILPMYWIVTALYVAVAAVAPHLGHPRNLGFLTLARNFSLTSNDSGLYLGVAWTLEREAIFYGLFAAGLLLPRIGLGFFWLWQVAIVAANLAHPQISSGPRGEVFFSLYNLGFGLGVLIAASLNAWRPNLRQAKLLFFAGVALYAAVFLCDWWYGAGLPHTQVALGDRASPLLYFTACWLIISGAVRYEMVAKVKGAKWLRLLGDSSYVLYLFHEAFISTIVRLIDPATPHAALIALLLALPIAVGAAALLHLVIEGPLLRSLRAGLLPRRPRIVPAIS